MMWAPGRLSRTDSMQSVPRGLASNRSSTYDDARLSMWVLPKEGQAPYERSNRLSRTASIQSIQSLASSRGSVSGDGIVEKSPPPRYEPVVHDIRLDRRESISSNNSHSTLAEDPAEHEMEAKTPTVVQKYLDQAPLHHEVMKPVATSVPAKSDGLVGPLERQLLALLSKVKLLEQDQPTVMADDYQALRDRVSTLEAEKKTWQKRHEALYALRDEDLANLIKIRGLLATERRLHDGLKKLRDEDLKNVLELRGKLAQFNWGKPKSPDASARSSLRQSMREGSDLWQAAKTAALEQRLLELEHANAKLKQQLDESGGVPNAATIHPAAMGTPNLATNWEDFFEDAARQRERAAMKVQQLRSENDTLRKDMARLEDRNSELEDTVHRLQRRV